VGYLRHRSLTNHEFMRDDIRVCASFVHVVESLDFIHLTAHVREKNSFKDCFLDEKLFVRWKSDD